MTVGSVSKGRTDRASRLIRVPPDRLWQAWFDPGELVRWLPPAGMTARLLAFDPVPGGALRMVLTYPPGAGGRGNTTSDSDEAVGRFVSLDPPNGFVQEADFRSDAPAFAGKMRMAWTFARAPGGTLVSITATNVPPGITEADHAAGLNASLAQLAAATEGPSLGPKLGPKT